MKIFRMVFSPIEVNTYLLSDTDGKCAIIDCGCYTSKEFMKLEKYISDNRLDPVLLLNTHCHLDHVFGNKMFLERYGLKTLYHPLEEKNRTGSVLHAELFGMRMEMPPEPERLLADGEEISFGQVVLKALHVPGHTAGSLAFYNEQEGVVFTGDALFKGSIGRSDLPGGNFDQLIESIKTRLFTLPPETVVYPGHGDETTIREEIGYNPFFNK